MVGSAANCALNSDMFRCFGPLTIHELSDTTQIINTNLVENQKEGSRQVLRHVNPINENVKGTELVTSKIRGLLQKYQDLRKYHCLNSVPS